MIYNFSHVPTETGRRVRFVVARDELTRAQRLLSAEWALDGDVIVTAAGARDVVVEMTPRAARYVVDALATVGGDAAVSARMLSTALDGMVDELRASRAVEGHESRTLPGSIARRVRVPG